MRAGLGLAAAGAVVVAALAGCGSGGSPLTAATPAPAASGQAQPSAVPSSLLAQRDCGFAAYVLNSVAGPLEKQDAAGVVAAAELAQHDNSIVGTGSDLVEYPNVVLYAKTVLSEVVTIGNNAVAYEQSGASWSVVTSAEPALADSFKSLESACSAAGVTIDGSQAAVTPAPSITSNPYSAGCPTSDQLLAAWNAAPASARDSWVTGLTPTGFTGTQCWHQWVVSNPVVQANGTVIFTDVNGQIAVFPASELSEFDAAVCGVPGIGLVWSGPAGPANCSQSG